MRVSRIAFVAVALLSLFVVSLDLALGPSLNLLSINNTALISITVISLALAGFAGRGVPQSGELVDRVYRVRRPEMEMYALVAGAREGYVSNRRQVLRIMKGAVAAKLDQGVRPPSDEIVERYLREALGRIPDSELLPPGVGNKARIPPSDTYVRTLGDALSLLEQNLGAQP